MSKGINREAPWVLNPEKIGPSLEEVSVDYLEVNNQKIKSRWLRGEEAELFIWTDQYSNIIKQQLSLLGQVVEWNVYDGVRTGLLIESDLDVEKSKTSELVQFDTSPQGSAIRQAREILKHTQILSASEQDKLILNFTGNLKKKGLRFIPNLLQLWIRKIFS